MVDCKYIKCEEKFERSGAKRYCCTPCRDKQRKIDADRPEEEIPKQSMPVSKEFLERGRITYPGYTTL